MPESIELTLMASVVGGPSMSEVLTLDVEAYDKLSVTVPKNTAVAAGIEVQLQPGAAGQVALVVVSSSRYDPDPLTYRINAETTDVTLDAPVVLIGAGAVGLLAAAPATLSFANASTTEDAAVSILIGRDATA